MSEHKITIVEIDPRRPEIVQMIAELDRLMTSLYPVENTFLVSPEDLAETGSTFIAAYVDGVASGCAAIMLRGQDYAEVKRVFVAPNARGLGLARRLLARLEERALSAGITMLRLETGDHQPDALSLFHSLGFEICERFGDYPEDAPHSVFMEKPCAGAD
jgi:putative acetyltransferase